MAGDCRHIRDKIAQSLSAALTPDELSEIDAHTTSCPSCREFTNALHQDDRRLAEFARSLEPSVARVEENAMRSLDSKPKTGPAALSFWDRITTLRVPRYAAAVVVFIAAGWGLAHFTGWLDGATPALADVMEQVKKARTVTYRQSYAFEGMDPFSTTKMITEPGIVRSILPHGDITIMDFNAGRDLHLMPGAKRAILTERTGRRQREGIFNYIDWVRTLHRQAGTFVGREIIDGQDANVFVVEKSEYHKTTIWADVDTDLPVRVQIEALPHPDQDVVQPEMSLNLRDFGGSENITRSVSISSSAGIQKKSKRIQQDFHWNVEFDEPLFRTTPPEGYELETREFDVSEGGETDLVEALRTWVELSQGSFPAAVNDLGNPDKVTPLLIEKFDRDGEPIEELELALAEANKMLKGLFFAQERKIDGTWHYTGEGVRLGDVDNPVCWWRTEGSEFYRVIYGDLRVADSETVGDVRR